MCMQFTLTNQNTILQKTFFGTYCNEQSSYKQVAQLYIYIVVSSFTKGVWS